MNIGHVKWSPIVEFEASFNIIYFIKTKVFQKYTNNNNNNYKNYENYLCVVTANVLKYFCNQFILNYINIDCT